MPGEGRGLCVETSTTCEAFLAGWSCSFFSAPCTRKEGDASLASEGFEPALRGPYAEGPSDADAVAKPEAYDVVLKPPPAPSEEFEKFDGGVDLGKLGFAPSTHARATQRRNLQTPDDADAKSGTPSSAAPTEGSEQVSLVAALLVGVISSYPGLASESTPVKGS